MNKHITTTLSLLVVFTLIASASTNIPFMEPTGNVVNKQLIKSQYGSLGELFGVGERIYKLTYDNGDTFYQLERSRFALASITSSAPSSVTINIGESYRWNYKLIGCCSGLDGNNEHQHKMILYNTIGDTTAMNSGDVFTVADGASKELISGTKTFDSAGVFTFKIKEFIRLWNAGSQEWVWASGNSIYLTVTVGSPSPTQTTPQPTQTTPQPTQTTPPPTGACADGTSNLACSSQKPLYCYYGSLINKASMCGCPSGQIISGDNCISPTPTSTPLQGKLIVTSVPTSATVYIDNFPKGNTPYEALLSTGSYLVEVKKSDYQTSSRTVAITSSIETRFDTTLIPISIPPPVTEQPLISISNIISQIWDWIKGFFGLASIIGAETINVGAGQQTYSISITSPEAPDAVYTDKTYSELYGTWFVVDSNQNIITQKSGWTKLSSTLYSDAALVTFPNPGSYSVVGVIVKVPYTYTTSWEKGTESIIAKEQIKVSVKIPTPVSTQPTLSIPDIILSILNWIKSLFGM